MAVGARPRICPPSLPRVGKSITRTRPRRVSIQCQDKLKRRPGSSRQYGGSARAPCAP